MQFFSLLNKMPGFRRTFQRTFLLLGAIFSLWSCDDKKQDNAEAEDNSRPNIIFIMADDHAVQAISAYGHALGKLAPTPNI
ncbi:MAG: hypothetical protein WCE57_07380, partial [Salegentibacter sp.]